MSKVEGLYHLHVKNISRKDGRSVVAAAAYRAGESLPNDLEQGESDFTRRGNVIHAEILVPDQAPTWMRDRAKLWNEVERVEKRKDARLAKEVECAIPRDIPKNKRLYLIRTFAQFFIDQGCVVDFVIHDDPGDHNPHVHVMLTTREITPDGFGLKLRHLDKRKFITDTRAKWEEVANKALGKVGSTFRIDHRSLEAQGICRQATKHRGPNRAERWQKRTRRRKNPDERHIVQEQPAQKEPSVEIEAHASAQSVHEQLQIGGNDSEHYSWWRDLSPPLDHEVKPAQVTRLQEQPAQLNTAEALTDVNELTEAQTLWWRELQEDQEINRQDQSMDPVSAAIERERLNRERR